MAARRTVAVEKRGMTAALILGQHVHLTDEVGVRMNGVGLRKHLTALDLVALHTAEQNARVVARLGGVQGLVEHLNAGDDHGTGLVHQADDLDGVADLDLTALNAPGGDRAAAGDGHDVLNGHQEGLIGGAHGSGDVLVHSVHQLEDALALGRVLHVRAAVGDILQRLERGALDDRDVVAGEVVGAQQLADLHLDQLEQLLVVHHIGLVHEHDDIGHADLTGKQDMLAGLGHRAVGRGHD